MDDERALIVPGASSFAELAGLERVTRIHMTQGRRDDENVRKDRYVA